MSCQRPHVGIGILIFNDKGEVLVGERKGSHAPYFSIPGGSLEAGESFEAAAIREACEETGLELESVEVMNVTNNLQTYREFGVHFVSVTLLAKSFRGTPRLMEPDKCKSWAWYDPKQLPQPHFDASQNGIESFLKNQFYLPA